MSLSLSFFAGWGLREIPRAKLSRKEYKSPLSFFFSELDLAIEHHAPNSVCEVL